MSLQGQSDSDGKSVKNIKEGLKKPSNPNTVSEVSHEDMLNTPSQPPIYTTKNFELTPVLIDFKNKAFDRLIKHMDLRAA